jgi:hypothetical protein
MASAGLAVPKLWRTMGLRHLSSLADYAELVERTLTIPRPVHVKHRTYIGKEVIVDPTDTDEGLTAEMLSPTEVLEYENVAERIEALRANITLARVKPTARAAGVSRSQVQAIVSSRATPHPETIAKLEAAVKLLRRANHAS